MTLLCRPTHAPTLVAVAITSRFDARHRLAAAAVTVVLVTALASILAVRCYHALLEETFRVRSAAYVQMFAASAGAWIEPLDVEMLQAAARFLLVGSTSYVRIERSGELIVDERGEEAASLELRPSSSSPDGAQEIRLSSGTSVLDVVVPLVVAGEAVGSVRIGIETTSVAARGRGMAMAAGGIAAGVDALILGLFLWSHWGRSRRKDDTQLALRRAPIAEPLVAGELRIDGATKTVTLKGQSVALTPKQYALLELLARHSGRVVPEEEILDDVWAESPYADSKDVKQYVYLLRKRLAKADPGGRDLIVTVPGFGYRIAPVPVDERLTER